MEMQGEVDECSLGILHLPIPDVSVTLRISLVHITPLPLNSEI